MSRFGLAASVGAASIAAIAAILAAAPASGGPAGLTPDLVTLPIEQKNLVVSVEDKKVLLRFSNEIGNQGNGPLEIFPGDVSTNCDGDGDPLNDRDASQRLFADSNADGLFERDVDTPASENRVGCMRYHAVHDHWHVLQVARYELVRERGAKVVALSRKVGFCLVDGRNAYPGVGSPTTPLYPYDSQSQGCDENATQGLSPGWADLYTYAVAGQQLNIGNLRRGRYCLTSEADPLDLLDELDEENNVTRARLMLRPNRYTARKLPGACRLKRNA